VLAFAEVLLPEDGSSSLRGLRESQAGSMRTRHEIEYP
jgi:hypothetical protein